MASSPQPPVWETGTTEVASGVFAYVQTGGGLCIANAGIIRGDADVTAIDALFTPAMTRALLEETRHVTGREPTQLINTHHHVDHTLGNALFPPSARIIAHARAKAEMGRAGLGALPLIQRLAPHFAGELDGVSERLPDITFDGEELRVDVGGRVLTLLHYGTGHTRGDVMVYLPGERVLFAGDVAFFYVTPLAHEGHIGNWINVIERVLDETSVETIVPGHGPVGTSGELRMTLGYLRLVRDHAKRAREAGASAEEAARSMDVGEYAEWAEPERTAINVGRVYRELSGELDDLLQGR